MAEANPKQDFSKQISETRKCIKDRLKKSHESLQLVARENILLARVDSIEHRCPKDFSQGPYIYTKRISGPQHINFPELITSMN